MASHARLLTTRVPHRARDPGGSGVARPRDGGRSVYHAEGGRARRQGRRARSGQQCRQRWGMAMMERLNLEGLRYAQAVAETKSFSAAARAYGVTQPALSTGIAKLEERLGGQLFDRSPRGVTNTDLHGAVRLSTGGTAETGPYARA